MLSSSVSMSNVRWKWARGAFGAAALDDAWMDGQASPVKVQMVTK